MISRVLTDVGSAQREAGDVPHERKLTQKRLEAEGTQQVISPDRFMMVGAQFRIDALDVAFFPVPDPSSTFKRLAGMLMISLSL